MVFLNTGERYIYIARLLKGDTKMFEEFMLVPDYPVLKYPMLLGISVTQKCNLRCGYCLADGGESAVNELTDDELFNILSYAAEVGIQDIDFSGGEPLTRPVFPEMLEFCYNKDLNVLLATNGTLIDDKFAKLLKKAIDYISLEIRISLDGDTRESHEKFREKGSFELVCQGITRLLEVGLIPNITMVVHRDNIAEIKNVLRFMEQKSLKKLHLMPFIPKGRGKAFKELALDQKILRFLLENKRIFSSQTGIIIEMESPLECLIAPPDDLSKPRRCAAGYIFLGILPEGSFFPCPHMRECIIGNIRRNTIEEVWREAAVLQDLRNPELLKGACRNCQFKIVCNGGCHGAAYDIMGDYLMPDPFCWIANPDGGCF